MTDNHIDITVIDLVVILLWLESFSIALIALGYCLAQLIQGQL